MTPSRMPARISPLPAATPSVGHGEQVADGPQDRPHLAPVFDCRLHVAVVNRQTAAEAGQYRSTDRAEEGVTHLRNAMP